MDLDLRGGQNGRRGLAEVIRRSTETEAKNWRPTAPWNGPRCPLASKRMAIWKRSAITF